MRHLFFVSCWLLCEWRSVIRVRVAVELALQDPRVILHHYQSLKAHNQNESTEIDNVFVRRQERDQQTQQVERQLEELQRVAAAKMDSLPPAKREKYGRLLEENRALSEEVRNKQSELERINADIEDAENELRRDPYRDDYARLEKMLLRVEHERDELEEEAKQTSLDPAEARERLLAKAKQDNARLMQLGQRLQEVQDTVVRKRNVRSSLAHALVVGLRRRAMARVVVGASCCLLAALANQPRGDCRLLRTLSKTWKSARAKLGIVRSTRCCTSATKK